MKKIDQDILKRLRSAKGWSQEQLAENTKFQGFPKIDKQTISRLERGDREKTRGRTIEQLARALKVEPDVLTGEAPLPELEVESEPIQKSQLNVRVSRAARNALHLVAQRYVGLEPSQIVELAPFLFCWVAEASLRQRRERLKQLENATETTRKLEREIFDVTLAQPEPPEMSDFLTEQIMRENQSIELGDIFGGFRHEDPDHFLDVNAMDPFSVFLGDLVADFPDISFERWFSEGTPSYVVCPEAAARLVGGDKDIAAMILRGSVLLNEMPKEIRGREMTKERAEWVRAKAGEYFKEQNNSDSGKEASI
jgi:transcriptional regulator with XRE-family HTH domain